MFIIAFFRRLPGGGIETLSNKSEHVYILWFSNSNLRLEKCLNMYKICKRMFITVLFITENLKWHKCLLLVKWILKMSFSEYSLETPKGHWKPSEHLVKVKTVLTILKHLSFSLSFSHSGVFQRLQVWYHYSDN